MKKKDLLVRLSCLLTFLGLFSMTSVNAQVVDDFGAFDEPLTGRHLIYSKVIVYDTNANGTFDAVFTLSETEIQAWTDYSVAVPFYTNGIHVRVDGSFLKTNDVIPVDGGMYELWIIVDVPAETYRVFAKSEEMEFPVIIYNGDAHFRKTDVSAINYWSLLHNPDNQHARLEIVDEVEIRPLDFEPTLLGLTTSIGEFEPDFNSEITSYELAVPYGTQSITVNAFPNIGTSFDIFDQTGALIGSDGVVPFTGDGVDLEILVTSMDGSEMPYWLYIFVDEGSGDPTLRDLQLSAGAIHPIFNREIFEYTAIVPAGTTTVDIIGTTNFPEATISGDTQITLSNGTATATITVTSADGSETQNYLIAIEEAEPADYAIRMQGGNGNNSHIDLSGLSLSSLPYTIEMWIRPDGAQPNNAGLFYNRENDNHHAGLQYSSGWQGSGRLRFMTNVSGDYGVLTDPIPTNTWQHVAVILNEDSRTIILDGIEYTQYTSDFGGAEHTINQPFDYAIGKLYIGWDNGDANRAFKGDIDEVRVWNRELTVEEINENKYEILNGDESGLVGYWNFDTPTPSYALDLTTNQHHGIIRGGTYVPSFPKANLNLESLEITDINIYPEFRSNVTEYYTVLPIGTTELEISAVAIDETASVSGTGTISISEEKGQVTIEVASADERYTQVYVINYIEEQPYALRHSYTFVDGTAKDVVSGANGTINGGVINNGTYIASEAGDYITLPAETIALNEYTAITLEAYVTNGVNESFTMLAYFGGMTGSNAYWMQPTRGGGDLTSRTEFGSNMLGAAVATSSGARAVDGANQHSVSVLTYDNIYWYIDGALQAVTPTPDNLIIKGISTENAWLGRGGWNDPSWNGTIHEFNIYSGEMDEQTVALRATDWPTADNTSNATLSEITVDGEPLEDFSTFMMEYLMVLPEGTTDIPVIEAVPYYENATVVINSPDNLPGTVTIEVTSANGEYSNTYSIELLLLMGEIDDATLIELLIDGVALENFDPAVLNYTIELPEGTTTVPVVTAESTNQGADVVITEATEIPGTTTIVVTAQDGITQLTYTVEFTEEPTTNIPGETKQQTVVFPTITDGSFTVKSEAIGSTISIFDMQGRVISRILKAYSEQTIDVPSPGMYIILVENNSNVETFRVIKSR
ncbi:LamG-like jellyroll fold domain-containing protein [Natronoflexus pectinivorans]|uniref:Putative secreted protein (Por secretion system target) n=1 Tax=Natronoflexus pectinivorans TaxID=682526 RepID=A0A4R2GLJ6_9BACT|nr:LamG-like jellyroll fold domain-containing protein [Natronoflexus pectinivorans]TCO09874.1 putative secreted protein (Por secretion system target) [Natronoflexus pectinivorans]